MKRCKCCGQPVSQGQGLIKFMLAEDEVCGHCRNQLHFLHRKFKKDGVEILCLYEYNETMRNWILQYKGCCDEALAPIFLAPHRSELNRRYRGYTLVPLPSSYTMLEQRGFHHVKKMAESLNLKIWDGLEKCDETKQSELNKAEREKIKGKIRVKEGMHIPDKIVLLDDIYTTGNTMLSAISCLKGKCIVLKAIVLALVDK